MPSSRTSKQKTIIDLNVLPIEDDGFHIFVRALINGIEANLLIDTGASRTVFDQDRIRQFVPEGTVFEKLDKLSTGLGTNTMESHWITLNEFCLGEATLKNYRAVTLDMQHVTRSYEMLGIPPIDGVIGGDLLVELGAVVDYNKKVMKIRH